MGHPRCLTMITTQHTSNIDAVLAEARLGVVGDHVLEIRNVADYAVELHAREGYSVLNDDVLRSAVEEAIDERRAHLNRRGELLTDRAAAWALEDAAEATVEFYQSVIGTTDRPGVVKLPPRPVHPGEWASDTENLVSSYESQVDDGPITKYPNPF